MNFIAVLGIDDVAIMVVISILLAATTMVLSELLRPKPKFEDARAAALGDFRFPTATEGRVIPILWGTVKIDGPNVVWYGDLRQVAITQYMRTGLWSGKRITKGFKYYVGMQMALCRGRIDALHRVWIGDDEVWYSAPGLQDGSVVISKPDLFGGQDFGSGGVDGTARLYSGRSDEPVPVSTDYLYPFQDPHLPYRGTCHLVWQGGYVGNTTSLTPWKFEVRRCPNGLGLGGGKHVVNTYDANPACVLYEILTDAEWGFGFPAADVDVSGFQAVGNTLYTEGNGFSLLLDNAKEATELLNEIQRQIDGVLYLDHLDGKFKLKLARADYDVDAVPQVTSANVLEVPDFTRGTWDETSNQVRIKFSDRTKKYAESYAVASDLANQRIQTGALVPATINFPGVKDRTLAENLAARQIKYLSTPLAKATVVVDRSLWSLKPGDVVAWTDAVLGFSKLPMRVGKVDFGSLKEGRIELTLVQDVFGYATSFDGVNGDSLWTPPVQGVQAFPSAQQLAFEAPYAIVRRDPDAPGTLDRLFSAGRAQKAGEIEFRIYERNAPGTPSGAYSVAGDVFAFMLIGQVRTAVTAGGSGQPDSQVDVDPTPDSVADLLAAFTPNPSVPDMGQNLVNLLLIEDEFCAVTTATNMSTYVRLGSVYRGLLDSVQKPHAVGAKVYLVFAGGGLSDLAIPAGNNVHVQLRPRSRDAEVTEAQATTISLTMANRCRRPYPATEAKVNGTRWPTSSNLDTTKSGGTTDDDKGVLVEFRRRDYRNYDEIQSALNEAGSIVSDFPTANTTQENCDLIKDPDGTPSTIESKAWATGTSFFFSRTKVLRANSGARPARLRAEVGTRHTYQGTVYEALAKLGHSFDTAASEIDGWTNMGVLTQNQVGATYTAPTAGTYAFSIGPNLPGGNVEARINGGSWQTVIAGGTRTGNLAGVAVNDTIEVRCTYGGPGTGETFLKVDAPSSAADAYAVLVL